MKYDLQQIDKLSVEKKLLHENEKQKVHISLLNKSNNFLFIFLTAYQ